MSHYDVFNGDADGLCALHQLRLETPVAATLVTGAKRDIALLQRVPAQPGDDVTVLDVSLAVNRSDLMALLERGARVQYFDHHYAGTLPSHPDLRLTIDTSPAVCTGILVDRHLRGRQRIWAVVAAFGDNLVTSAVELATSLPLTPSHLDRLRELGETLAYNAYGDSEDDLIIHPRMLYQKMRRYADPFRFMDQEPIVARIAAARRRDLEDAASVSPFAELPHARIYVLPDAAWSRRVRGIFGNRLANERPRLAHAILTPNARAGYVVSVRAPAARGTGADAFCRGFAEGGGRERAAGIDHLPREALPDFMRRFDEAFR